MIRGRVAATEKMKKVEFVRDRTLEKKIAAKFGVKRERRAYRRLRRLIRNDRNYQSGVGRISIIQFVISWNTITGFGIILNLYHSK